jgi:hypothetical protein
MGATRIEEALAQISNKFAEDTRLLGSVFSEYEPPVRQREPCIRSARRYLVRADHGANLGNSVVALGVEQGVAKVLERCLISGAKFLLYLGQLGHGF